MKNIVENQGIKTDKPLPMSYEALKAERDALAVENAAMRGVIDAAIGVANNSSGIAGWHLNGEIADWDEILPELNIETPATDAALAAIRDAVLDLVISNLGAMGSPDFTLMAIQALKNELREAK
ncbi:hypothetical protein [Serratia marcescens]|uniref:hypothetical protein n=1 Tax=Serratia marcescens TaxID=615 RepID=UPI003877A945